MLRIALPLVAAVWAGSATAETAALLIGTEDYDRVNDVRRADDVAAAASALTRAEVRVVSRRDADLEDIQQALGEFGQMIEDSDRLLVALGGLGIAGLIAGVLGVTLIMGARLSAGVDLYGVILCAIGAMALTAATLLVRGATSGGNFLMIVGLQMLFGCAALTVSALLFETPRFNPTWPLFFAFTYTCLVPGLLATVVWFWLVNRVGATRAATFHFLNPFFGVAVAAVLLSEPLGGRDVIGVVIIAAGILAVQLSRQKSNG